MLVFPAKSEEIMGTDSINWEAALAEVEGRIAKLQATAEGIRMIIAQGGSVVPSPGGGGGSLGPSAFLGMSIPDATKKYLSTVKQKKSTQEIIDALTAGGLPKSKYTTVYAILARRQKQVEDIVNMKGDWGLAEWYPNHRFKTSKEESDKYEESPEEKKIASA
jgi:hypothetical protein